MFALIGLRSESTTEQSVSEYLCLLPAFEIKAAVAFPLYHLPVVGFIQANYSLVSHLFDFSSTILIKGDNPSCSGGAPIGLSWEYNPEIEALPLEDYEDTRGPRRTSKQMAMPRSVREEILRREWGAKQSDMAQAVRENLRIKNSRRRTVNNLDTSMTKVEEKMEGVKKSLKKSLGLRKSFRKQYDQWQSQAQEAAALAERLNAEAMIAEENAAAAYIAEEEARSTAQVASENDVARLSLSSDAPDSFLKVHPVVIKEEEEGEEEAADGEQDNPALASEPIINCDNAPITKNTVLPTKTLDSSQSSGAPTYEAHHSVNRLPIKATRRSFSSQMA